MVVGGRLCALSVWICGGGHREREREREGEGRRRREEEREREREREEEGHRTQTRDGTLDISPEVWMCGGGAGYYLLVARFSVAASCFLISTV